MSRCDYDTIFQRVFCVTLVAIALTFTVILTNVFVDIDGLLSSKSKLKTFDVPVPVLESEIRAVKVSNLIRPDTFYKEEKNYEENNDENYRNKRSIESSNILFQIKNPKLKSILSNRLATLLEELDEDENAPNNNIPKPNKHAKTKEDDNKDITTKADDIKEKEDEQGLLHLAMHNILLQGIIGHMDLNDVYKKVHALVKDFKDVDEDSPKEKIDVVPEKLDPNTRREHKEYIQSKTLDEIKSNKNVNNPSLEPFLEENKIIEELTKCDKLENDIASSVHIKNDKETKSPVKGPKLLIKTIIDITSNTNNRKKKFNSNSKENIRGIVQLVYNGKSIKFSRMEDEDNQLTKINNEKPSESIDEKFDDETKDLDVTKQPDILNNNPESMTTSNNFFNKIIDDYLKIYPTKKVDNGVKNVDSKRLKRHIKIRYRGDNIATTQKPKRKKDGNDDELFVEIETHFDSKGMKAGKKKKLIRNIIEKIKKVINADIKQFNHGKKKKHRLMQIKKRNLNPLGIDKKLIMNQVGYPIHAEIHSAPLSKVALPQNLLPGVSDKSGEKWKKINYGPAFLSVSKSVNSAEMGKIDIDYNKVLPVNGIPQRLQKPINTDDSDETNANPYFDLGKLKFIVENIDGTGLSIGFNQYTDEAPDPEAINIFTGIDKLTKSLYPNKDAETSPSNDDDERIKNISEDEVKEHQLSKRNVIGDGNKHVMIRRSVRENYEKDYHSNEYNVIYDYNFLPYKSYQEILEDQRKRVASTLNKKTDYMHAYNLRRNSVGNVELIKKNIKINDLPTLMDEKNNIFYKKLKPSEILTLASLLKRKKRSTTMHKITNLHKKMKVNRFMNTRALNKKKIILKKRRSKRQVDKIRIIATDEVPEHRHSEENIFLVGDENLLADRAIIREVDSPDVIDIDEKMGDQYDVIPVLYEEPQYTTHIFDSRSRHNNLMAKYPHIFLEEISKSKEEFDPPVINNPERRSYHMDDIMGSINAAPVINNPERTSYNMEDIMSSINSAPGVNNPERRSYNMEDIMSSINAEKPPDSDATEPKLEDFVETLDPKQNIKLIVKIYPKNGTVGENTGFKEIHASINKSYNKDGIKYSSLVNVSEISKVEHLNKNESTSLKASTPALELTTPSTLMKYIQEQQRRMDSLVKQHKKKIDEQLENFNKEHVAVKIQRNAMESPFNPALPLSHDDVSRLVASALMHLQNRDKTTFAPITTTTTTTTSTTTTTTTTTPRPSTATPEVSNTINRDILTQIVQNTQMLQLFLQKLTDKLSLRTKSEEEKPKDYVPRYWRPFHEQPATFNGKNSTNVPLPFVYSFQQPYPMNIGNPMAHYQHIPIASVVYHGHIHTCINKFDPKCKEKEAGRNLAKQKYFIDDEEGFKIVPVKTQNLTLPVTTTGDSSTTKTNV